MELQILDEQHVRLVTTGDGGFDVVGDHFGPLQMLAASLALCTASVVQAYSETAQLNIEGFGVDVNWEYVDDPYRVGTYQIELQMPPTVPPARHRALVRAADTCTVHNTLLHAPQITTTVAVVEHPSASGEPKHVHRA